MRNGALVPSRGKTSYCSRILSLGQGPYSAQTSSLLSSVRGMGTGNPGTAQPQEPRAWCSQIALCQNHPWMQPWPQPRWQVPKCPTTASEKPLYTGMARSYALAIQTPKRCSPTATKPIPLSHLQEQKEHTVLEPIRSAVMERDVTKMVAEPAPSSTAAP